MDLLERLKEKAAGLSTVRLAILFGSFARGEAQARSDVDLALWLEPDGIEDRFRAEAEMGRAARRDVHCVFLPEAPPLLRFEIARDGVLLHADEEGTWSGFRARAMLDWWDWAPYHRQIHEAQLRRLRAEVRNGQA
jgi:predicted nucleotidyltransferase